MQAEINLDELVRATYLDENIMPESIKHDPFETEFWRLNQCFKILKIQQEIKQKDGVFELTEIPIYKTLAETFAKIAEKRDIFMDHYATLRTSAESQIIKQTQAKIDSLLQLVTKQVSDEMLTNILVVQKILVGLQERVSSLLNSPAMQHQLFTEVLNRQNLDVLNAFLNLLEPGPDSVLNSAQLSNKPTFIIEALINQPQQMSKSASFISFLQAGVIGELSLPQIQQQDHQHPGFTYDKLVNDKRKMKEIAEEYLGKKIDKLNSPIDQKLVADTLITLFLVRVSKKPDFHYKLLQTSVKALKYKHLSEGFERSQIQRLGEFTEESIKYLKVIEDPLLAADILDILSIRLLRSSTRDIELKYYLSECEQVNENGTEEVFDIDNLSIFKMLKQISQMKVVKKDSKEDVDMSDFEKQDDQWTFKVSNDFFKTNIALHPEVKARIQKLVRVFKQQIKKIPNSQERQSFITKINTVLVELELKMVRIDLLESNPQVLTTGCPFAQMINSIHRFSAEVIYSVDQSSLARDYELLIESWVKKSKQTILSLENGQNGPIEMTRMQKATIIAELVNQLSDDSIVQNQQRVVFPNDFGARLIAGNLFKIFQTEILPLYDDQQFVDPATDLILTAFINLISTIIHNEPGLISQMLKPKEDNDKGVINLLLTALSKAAPKSQTYMYIQSDAFESIVYKLFSRLLVTEAGKTAVHENSLQIIDELLQGRKQITNYVYYMGERKQIKGILIKESNYDQISKVKPIATALREEFKQTINLIQSKSAALKQEVEKFKKLHEGKNLKDLQLIQQFFFYERLDVCELQELLALVSISNRRSYFHHQREPTISIVPILKENNNSKAILEQYEGILTSIENLCMFDSQFINSLVNQVRIIIEESYQAGHQDQLEVSYILTRMKNCQQKFLDYIDVFNANSVEDLTIKPNFISLFSPVLLYNKILLKKLSQQFSNKLGVFADWKQQIPQLIHLALLISQQSQQLERDLVHEKPIEGLKIDLSEIKKIEITKDLNSFIPWYDQIEKVVANVQKYQKRVYILNASKDSYPFQFLKLVQFTSTQRHQRQINANSIVETANGNHGAFGEQIAILIQKLLVDGEDVDAIITQNAPIIKLISTISQDYSLFGMYHIKFILNNGVKNMCQIYKKLDELQDKLFSDDKFNENVYNKATIIAYREVVIKMLMGVVQVSRRFEATYSKIDVKKETNNKFENLNHLLVNQFNQLFNEFFLWNKNESEQKPLFILDQRKPNFDQVMESLVQAFSEKSWTAFEGGEGDNGRGRMPSAFGRPGRPANNPNRQPTQEEIQIVAALGYSPEIARGAIQMANFDINQAVELILSNELGVIQFVQRQQQQEAEKNKLELERMMKQQFGLDQKEQEQIKAESAADPAISIEDFQKLYDGYKLKLASTLLELGSDTVIDCSTALPILKKLNSNLTKGQLLEIVISKLSTWDDCSKKAFQLQVLLMQIQVERPDSIVLPKIEQILTLGNDFIKLATENPKANQALYFLCLYLYHTLKNQDFTDQIQTFLLNVLDGPNDCGQKEIVTVIVSNIIQNLPQQQTQKIALRFVKKLDLEWALDSPFSTQLEKLAIWSDSLAERLLKQFLSECFLAKLFIKQDQLKKQGKAVSDVNDSLKFKYNDLIKELSLVSKDNVLVKQALLKNCKIFRNSVHTEVICQLSDEKVKELITQIETAESEIASVRRNYTNFSPIIEIHRNLDNEINEINEYERQTIATIFSKIQCALEEGKGLNQKLAEKALQKFRIIARFIMLNSSNLNLLKTLIPNDNTIPEWFIDDLCSPCLILANAEKPDELQLKPYPDFQKNLISLLTLVATSKLSTNYEEFKQKYFLRVRFLKQAVQTISANKELKTIENKSKALAGLEVIRTLITYQNQYEFNRVVCQQQDFFDSIQTLVLQTKFVGLVEELLNQLQAEEIMPIPERDLFIACIVDLLQTICEYIELLRAEEKQKKNIRKNKLSQAAEVKEEEVKAADEPMVEENQAVIAQPAQIVAEQVIQMVQGDGSGSENQSDDGDDNQDDDDQDDDDDDQNQDEEMDVDGEGEMDDDDYYDEEDEEEKELVVPREGQAQNDILRRPVVNRQPDHRRQHPFPVPDFINYRARHEQRGADEQAFDENWTVQEQHIRALINQISDHLEPRDGLNRISKNEIKRCQNLIENCQMTQKFDILKHLDLKQTTQLLQKNYQKFEQQYLSQKAKPVRVLTRVDPSQNGRRQHPYSFIQQIGNGGLFGPEAIGLENMQERLRRIEEFMLQQRIDGLEEEDFMFGPPRELFGMEHIRRPEEERIDLINFDNNPNRIAVNQGPNSLIALSEQILQELNQEGVIQTLVSQPELRFEQISSIEDPNSNSASHHDFQGSQNIVVPPPILGNLLPPIDFIVRRRASNQNVDESQQNQVNQDNQQQQQVENSAEVEQAASDQVMQQPQIQSQDMLGRSQNFNIQIIRQPNRVIEEPQIDQLLQQVDNLMGQNSPNVEMAQQEEEKQPAEQEVQQPVVQQAEQVAEPFTFGFPNSVLLEHEIDPEILHDLPEEVRVELLSTVNWQPPQNNVQPPAEVQQVQQPAQQDAQANAAQQEEAKDELGIDQEFLANLPEDIREEILMNQRMLNRNLGRNSSQVQQPGRQPEVMDVASIIATVTDPQLRREMILGLEESQIATLPPNLRAEAVQLRQQMNEERARSRREMELLFQRQQQQRDAPGMRGRGMFHQAIFGDREELDPNVLMHRFLDPRLQNERDLHLLQDGRDPLPNEVFFLFNSVSQPVDTSNLVAIETKLADSEVMVPSFLSILFQVEKLLENPAQKQPSEVLRFNLLPTLNSLMTLHKDDGTLQNKQCVMSALQDGLFELFSQVNSPDTEKVTIPKVLFKISVLRLLIHLNKKNAIHLIRDFFFSSTEAQTDQIQTQLKNNIVKTILHQLQDQQKQPTDNQSESHLNKAFLRNLQLCLTDIFGEIDRVFEKSMKQKSNQNVIVAEETIKSITQVLEFSSTDKNLVESIGKALKSLAKGQKENWTKIFSVCAAKLKHLQTAVIKNLKNIVPNKFEDEEMEEYSVPLISRELSLNYNMSQQQNSEMSPEKQTSSKVVMAKSEVAKIESILRQSVGELKYLVNLVNVFNIIYKENIGNESVQKDLKDEQLTLVKKSHLNVMNEILKHVSSSKSVKNQELLSILKLHVNCIFEYYILELQEQRKKVVSEDKAEPNDSIKMKPVQMQQGLQTSNRNKVTSYVFGDSEQYNTDNLYEFAKFCLNNKTMINELVAVKTTIHDQSLNFDNLVQYMPNVLNFENKRVHFKKELEKMRRDARRQRLGLVIKRADIFTDAYAQLNHKSAQELQGNLHIDFAGERGQDAGGLTRDFFIELSRAMFNPNYSLFNLTSNGVTYYPNAQSYVNPEHLNFFKFIGRMIGKALFDGHLLECYFSKPLYKMMVGEDISFEDQQDLDNDYYRSCKWALENSVDDQELYFSVTTDYFGKIEEKELIPGGSNIKVNDENKIDYFKKMGYYRMYDAIKPQIDAFLKGFHELIPKKLVKIFSFSELELLISGLPNFDLNDLRANTEYQGGYTEDSPQVKWLWQTLATCSKEDIGRFLQFVTGSSKIPLEGFKALQGMRGPQNFTIARVRDITRLPQGHTCYNQFDMPEYPTYELLNERVLYAIKETVGFGFG